MKRVAGVEWVRRWQWSAVALLVVGVALLARGDDPPDLLSFGERGGLVLSGHLSQVYAGSWNQAGPLQLVAARLLMVGSSTDRPLFGIELAVDLALLSLLGWASRRSGVSMVGRLVLTCVSLAWIGPAGLWSGHPVEVAIPVLWLVGARSAVSGHWVRCGVVLGLGILVAPWAALGLGVVFAGRSRVLPSIGLAILVAVGGYLPFALSGHFDLFGHVWVIDRGTLVHLLAPGLTHFGWGLRVLQAIVAGAGCIVAARCLRGRADLVWVAPLMAVLTRILLDPVLLSYYWLPAGVLVIAGAALRPVSARVDIAVVALLIYLAYFGAVGIAPVAFAGLAIATAVVILVRARASTPPPARDAACPMRGAQLSRNRPHHISARV